MLLMHKDIPVCSIKIMDNSILAVTAIYNAEHLPVGVYKDRTDLCAASLRNWQAGRTIPYNRKNIDEVTKSLGCSIPEASVLCNFLSLTDCYWIKDESSDLFWKDINFHDNGFSNQYAMNILEQSNGQIDNFHIPDIHTDGVLPKLWISLYNRPHLVKFGQIESANEVTASRIADLLRINHVKYTPFFEGGKYGCVCPCFIEDSNKEIVNGLQVKKDHAPSGMQLYNAFCGMGFEKETNDMIRFIHLIHNTDCHDKNFGYERDAESLSPVRFLPLFDSGTSFGLNPTKDMRPFSERRMEQFKLSLPQPVLPEKSIVTAILRETYEEFHISGEALAVALSDIDQTYKETEREFYSVLER